MSRILTKIDNKFDHIAKALISTSEALRLIIEKIRDIEEKLGE